MNHKLGKRKRRLLVGRSADRRPYFHGGNAGLKVSGYILPPSVTGAPQNGDVPFHIRGNAWIYMNRELVKSALWAAQHQNPVVYEVEPEGVVENDPDVEKPELSYRAYKAKIIAIHQVPPDMLAAARKELLKSR